MKITVDYAADTSQEIYVADAEYLGNYVIRIHFNTNETRVVDFKAFLIRARHPSVKKYQDEQLFRDFTIQNGNLSWNDYELAFPVADLYENTILQQPSSQTER